MVFAFLRIALVFMLGVGAVAAECNLRDSGDAHYTTSLLQMSMKMDHQPRALRHNMKAAPSGTRILEAYNTCHPHAYPYLEQGEVVIHPASDTHFIHIYKNAGTTIKQSIAQIGGSGKGGWHGDDIREVLSNKSKKSYGESFTASLVRGWHGDDIREVLSNKNKKSNGKWFTASLVRDPLKRSLSAFHEVWKRRHCVPPRGECHGEDCDSCTEGRLVDGKLIDKFRELLLTPQSSLLHDGGAHMLPQVSFLLYSDGSKVALDYVGSLDDGLENEFHFMFDTQIPLENTTGGCLQETDLGRIEPTQLPEDVLVQVCKAYHDDYCCFGYDFPDACKTAGLTCQ